MLRDYQQKGVQEVINSLERHQAVIRQSPTGSGKTLEIKALADKFISERKNVLILTHRREILEQIVKLLPEAGKIIGSVFEKKQVMVASVMSYSKYQDLEESGMREIRKKNNVTTAIK